MKRSTTILAVSAVLATFAISGCNPIDRKTTDTFKFPLSSEEKIEGGSTSLTEFTWDYKTMLKTGETKSVDGAIVYTISDFESGRNADNIPTSTRIRTSYTPDGIIREKLVSTYGLIYGTNLLETKYEEFLLSGENADESVPVRYTLTEYNNGNDAPTKIEKYEYDAETSTHVMVLSNTDYAYNSYYGSYSYKETDMRTGSVTHYRHVSDEISYTIYARYGESSTEVAIERRTDYQGSELSDTFKVTRYDSAGENPVVINVTNRYKEVEVEY